MNKTIKYNLKTKLKNLKGRWADDLPEVFWAYRATARLITWIRSMVSVKLRAGSLRRDNFDPEKNMILQQCEFDFLEEKRRDL